MTVTNGSTGAGATPRAAARGQERLHRLALPAAPLLGLLLAGVAVLAGSGRPGQAAALAFGPQAPPAAAELSARQPVSPTIFLPVVLQPPAARNFWLATYYVGESLAGDPVYTAEETRIDYDWGDDGHPPGVSYDHFSARWVGDWEMEVGRYTFFVYADDGVRLWVDGRLVVDAWTPGMGDHEATVDVVEAGAHNLRLEYFEVTGGAAIRLHWRRTDLYPRWEAEYYRLPWVQEGLLYETLDDTIQFDWGLGAPAGLPTDGFSVAWHTRRLFEPGTNRLYLYADDGYRLWLDGNLLGQGGWEDGEAGGQVDVVYTYEAPALGYHNVTYQFHDRGSLAEARLWPEYAERPAWQAAYFPNRTLSGDPVAVRDEDAVFYDWSYGKPRPALPSADDFSVRWSGNRYFHSGCYRFGVFADDGVRLRVDGELLVNEWHDGRSEYHGAVKYLAEGLHEVIVEYYEARGEAEIRLWWE